MAEAAAPEMVAEAVGRPLRPLFVLSQVNNRLRNEHRHPLLLGLVNLLAAAGCLIA